MSTDIAGLIGILALCLAAYTSYRAEHHHHPTYARNSENSEPIRDFEPWPVGCPVCKTTSQYPRGHEGNGVAALVLYTCWACGADWKMRTKEGSR